MARPNIEVLNIDAFDVYPGMHLLADIKREDTRPEDPPEQYEVLVQNVTLDSELEALTLTVSVVFEDRPLPSVRDITLSYSDKVSWVRGIRD